MALQLRQYTQSHGITIVSMYPVSWHYICFDVPSLMALQLFRCTQSHGITIVTVYPVSWHYSCVDVPSLVILVVSLYPSS